MSHAKLAALLVLALAGGCTATPFVYHPRTSPAAGPRAPVRVVVLPFANGTEDFVERIVYGKERRFNLSRKGFANVIGAVPPELWARAFAQELDASGRFRSAGFAYGREEAGAADVIVEGTLLKAYGPPGEWALALRATRTAGGGPVWSREVSRTFTRFDMAEIHERLDETMRELFEEAGADLARTLAGPATDPGPAPASPVEQTIRRVLGGP